MQGKIMDFLKSFELMFCIAMNITFNYIPDGENHSVPPDTITQAQTRQPISWNLVDSLG